MNRVRTFFCRDSVRRRGTDRYRFLSHFPRSEAPNLAVRREDGGIAPGQSAHFPVGSDSFSPLRSSDQGFPPKVLVNRGVTRLRRRHPLLADRPLRAGACARSLGYVIRLIPVNWANFCSMSHPAAMMSGPDSGSGDGISGWSWRGQGVRRGSCEPARRDGGQAPEPGQGATGAAGAEDRRRSCLRPGEDAPRGERRQGNGSPERSRSRRGRVCEGRRGAHGRGRSTGPVARRATVRGQYQHEPGPVRRLPNRYPSSERAAPTWAPEFGPQTNCALAPSS